VDGKVAVLGVVIAGVIASVVEPGYFTWGSTVIGLTLLFVLVAYGGADKEETGSQSLAYGAALAFALLLIPGYLLNYAFFDQPFYPPSSKDPDKTEFNSWDTAYLLTWLALTVVSFSLRRCRVYYLWRKQRGRQRA
jgi:hypothetical protein